VEFFKLLACPKCGKELQQNKESLYCEHCKRDFLFHVKVPVFIDEEFVKKSAIASHQKKSTFLERALGRLFKPMHHSVYMDTLESSNNAGKQLKLFLSDFKENQIVLNVGSLSKKFESQGPKIINLDISMYPNIDIVADAHHLPFKDEGLDGIVIKNVFEHLQDPVTVRNELKRVLKKGGKIFAKVPFLQPFHAVPDDYQRWTINGLKEFFKDFKIIKEGISVGPSSSLAWFLQEYFGILFSFNTKRGYIISKTFFSFIFSPVKYFDFFFRKKKDAHRLASAFYMILEK